MSRSASRAGAAGALLASGIAFLATAAGTRGALPAPPAGAALEALAQPALRPPLASERIYFVLPDRYANGDRSNDRGGLTGPRGVTGFDPTDVGWYHGGDLAGLTADCSDERRGLARIRSLGFTTVWITPPFGQRAVQGDSAAYHGYWIRDFTSVDPRLGTEQEFASFVGCAHRLGLKVFLDVVVNHTADVIRPVVSSYSDAPYRDCRGRVFQPARYTGAKTFPCLRATTMPRVPLLAAADRSAKRPAWLNDVRLYHNRGDIAFDSCSAACLEQGDFFGLDDLFTEQPRVVNGLAEVYAGWIRRYRIDGFRIDTATHVNAAFFRIWAPKVLAAARAAGVPHFQLFGEVFLNDAVELAGFVRDRGLPNVLDFPLQDALVRYSAGTAGALGLANRLHDDDYFRLADGVAPTPPTFLGNHDLGRVGHLLKSQSGASGQPLLRRALLAHSLLYLLRGAPVAYYGDEVGIIGRGGDKQARQDLFPTQVPEWRTEERLGSPPIGSGSAFDVVAHPVAARLKVLAALREANPALSHGASVVRHAARSTFVVSRIDLAARQELLAAFNAGTAAARVTVTTATPGTRWTDVLGATEPAASDTAGRLSLTVPPLTAVLLRADGQVPVNAPGRPVVRVAPDDLSALLRVSAALPGGPASVTFAVRRPGGSGWQRAGVDDSPPYRVFLDPRRLRSGERISVVAVARGLDGRVALSPVVSTTVRRG